MYETVGAVEKNKDSLSQNLLFVMKSKFFLPTVKIPHISYFSEHCPIKYATS